MNRLVASGHSKGGSDLQGRSLQSKGERKAPGYRHLDHSGGGRVKTVKARGRRELRCELKEGEGKRKVRKRSGLSEPKKSNVTQ